jgi:formylglycine-generating enzyme
MKIKTLFALEVLFAIMLMSRVTSTSQQAHHKWNIIDHKYYQIESTLPIPPSQDLSQNSCSMDMVHVKGEMKQDADPNPYGGGSIEYLQKTTCTSWINREFPERCRQFDRDQWLKISAGLKTKPMDFCIDQYEYPNKKGQYPIIFVAFHEAEKICAAENKRICTETEWTFACEGPEAMPYPYGYARDATACVIDRPYIGYHGSKLRPREGAAGELDRLWQGVASGDFPRCVSPFGVYDLTGNVDEWTRKDRFDGKYPSILKGGYWGRVRTRCRPSTRSHNQNHIFYQQGVRCCSDSK